MLFTFLLAEVCSLWCIWLLWCVFLWRNIGKLLYAWLLDLRPEVVHNLDLIFLTIFVHLYIQVMFAIWLLAQNKRCSFHNYMMSKTVSHISIICCAAQNLLALVSNNVFINPFPCCFWQHMLKAWRFCAVSAMSCIFLPVFHSAYCSFPLYCMLFRCTSACYNFPLSVKGL